MTVIDTYLENIDTTKRKELERIREIAKKIIPGAGEVISYGMPALIYKGKPFLGFSVHKNHIGIYPYGGEEIEKLKGTLKKHRYSFSKGAIRIPYYNPIPESLLKKIITLRIKRITAQA